MSNSSHSPLPNESLSAPETDSRRFGRLRQPAQFLSFWIAIALPFAYLPLLANGLGEPTTALAFVSLLVINVVALYLGHGYNQ